MHPLAPVLQRPLCHVFGLSLCVNLLALAPAVFMLQVFDRVLSSRSGATLLALLVGVAVALGLALALDHLRSRLQGVIGNLAADALAPAVARAVVAQRARGVGEPSGAALHDVGTLRGVFSAQGLLALFDAPWAVIYVGVIALAHPLLGAAAGAAALLMLALALLNDRLTRRPIEAVQRASADAARYLEASLSHAEVVHALGMTDALIARWRDKNTEAAALQRAAAGRSVALAALIRMLRQAVQVLMLAAGAWLVITAQASPGVMIACTVLLGRALAPVEQVVGSWKLLAEGRAAWRRLGALLDAAAAAPARMALPAPLGQLSAHQLVYRAPSSERLLVAGVSLELDPGESLAIVGPSGAGKSTLVRLLTGAWQPNAGTVRLDGCDLALWPRPALGPSIGYVPQDVELFPGTVAQNIARLQTVDAAAVVRAAQRARVHEMILGLEAGYDTVVDPSGSRLSPGQRQRIALARALYGDPRLVVLDEPNANLDGAGEQALAEALRELRGQATVVVVTHRSTLTREVDKMLVLEAGRAAHFGPVAQVMQALAARGAAAPAGAQVLAMPRVAAHGAAS